MSPKRTLLRIVDRLRALRADRGANTALTLALLSVPLFGAVGFGVDYANAMRVRSSLQDVIDSASLTAAREFDTKGDDAIKAMVRKLVRSASFDKADLGKLVIDVDRAKRSIVTTGTVKVKTTVAALFGQDLLEVSATSAAVAPTMEYVNVYLLLDSSASMGLAATVEDAAKMQKGVGCQFGCHEKEGGQTQSNLDYALKNGIKLRIDTEHEGIAEILRVTKSVDPTSTYVRIGLSYFDEDLENKIAPTTDRKKIEAATTDYSLGNGTFFSNYIDSFSNYVGKGGSGKTASDPRKIVLMVTDGAQSSRPWVHNAADRWRIRSFDPKYCEKLKDNDVTVAVLDAVYLPIPGDWGYEATLGQPSTSLAGKTRRDEIEPNLKTCASPTYYLSAADAQGMRTGMASLLSRYLGTVRLTH